jgi:hypothetical protein
MLDSSSAPMAGIHLSMALVALHETFTTSAADDSIG